jgi:hypothetical protein
MGDAFKGLLSIVLLLVYLGCMAVYVPTMRLADLVGRLRWRWYHWRRGERKGAR